MLKQIQQILLCLPYDKSKRMSDKRMSILFSGQFFLFILCTLFHNRSINEGQCANSEEWKYNKLFATTLCQHCDLRKWIDFDCDLWKKNYPYRDWAKRMIEQETIFGKIVINKMIIWLTHRTLLICETMWHSSL